MKLIYDSKGNSTKVDDEDFEYLSQFKWNITKNGRTCYASRPITNEFGIRTRMKMHREIMKAKNGEMIDHINGDGTDNRKENLRYTTKQLNAFNMGKRPGTSKYKGVCRSSPNSKWTARIQFNYKGIYLGYFEKEEDAALAYNKKAIELFGEHARLNIIESR